MATTYSRTDSVNSGDQARSLADIAKRLSEISRQLAAEADETKHGDLIETSEALGAVAEDLAREEQQRRLRKKVLQALAERHGSALSLELETATLSLPDELAPVLRQLVDEGLVEVQPTQGGDMVTLTRQGWKEAQS